MMDEYITRNNAISAVCFGCNQQFSDEPCEPSECSIRQSIMALPTADVVSKSEVDRLTEELKTYNRVCGKLLIKDGVVVGKEVGKEVEYIHRDIAKILKQIAVNQTKIEVAKKIFEEIESILEPIIRLNYAISVQHEDAIERAKAISAEQALRAFRDYVAELKKKYTESEKEK